MRTPTARRVFADDRGAALALVAILGATLAVLMSVMLTRGIAQFGNTAADECWEQSLATADSALGWGLAQLEADETFTTGEALPASLVGSGDERAWAREAALAVEGEDLISTPEGEGAFIRPVDSAIVYAIGFCPERDAANPRVRVIRATWEGGITVTSWQLTWAFLTNDDLKISGNPTFHGAAASAHSNGSVDVSGNPDFKDGCLTASDGGTASGNLKMHSSCPPAGTRFQQPVEIVPEVIPIDHWHLSEYDMCPDGKVRAGPAHPTLYASVGSEPCTGQVLDQDASSPYRGWKFEGCCDSKEWAKWLYDTNTKNDGAYFFHEGTVRVPNRPGTNGNPWRVLMIVGARGSCDSVVAGDLYISGSAVLAPYTAGSAHADNTMVVIAGRDVEWSGTGRLELPGVVAAHEQIKINGNPQVEGGFIAEAACDSPNSNIHDTEISGNPTVNLDGAMDTGLTTDDGPGYVRLVDWDEL
ncbi:MAG: hypothetical protein WD184_00285 [Acidimicrobiia bacterium]